MMLLNNKYNIGEYVYLVTDSDQIPRLVVGINILPGYLLVYEVQVGITNSSHYDFELSAEENKVIKVK